MKRCIACVLTPLCFMVFVQSVYAQAYTRSETITYHDNTSKWVLGQVAKVTCVAPTTGLPTGCGASGTVISETTYDVTYALPLTRKSFGKLQQILGYDTTSTVASGQLGTLKTVRDGNNNITTLSSWARGIPQSIRYPITPESPTGAVRSAVVNNNGEIDSVTDEIGAKTCYTYDPVGRLASITYPSEGTPGACDTAQASWNTTTITFQPVAVAEYDIPAGHWTRIVQTGTGRHFQYFDALWRPLILRDDDSSQITATRKVTRNEYDDEGRVTFTSYPVADGNPPAIGIRTEYDALGRLASVSQDSELGLLTSTTEYLPGFKTRNTNPKLQQTTTSYMAWDQPSYDLPVAIAHPEGAFTDITRDIFGKATMLKRRNGVSSLAITRTYTFNANQELCRSLEPETGATLTGYDGAGNLAWSAAGLPVGTACDPSGTTLAVRARKASRTFDARNRVKTLTFPDGLGDQVWVYNPDGLPAEISTYNYARHTSSVVNSYAYNERRMLIGESVAFSGKLLSTVYGYDTNGALTNHTYPSGLVVDYAPNALGQPSKAGTFANGATYYPNGALKQFTYGNGIVHSMSQNTRGLPDTSCDFNGSCTASAVLFDAYDYDANGNVASISDGRTGHRGDRTMTYDNLDRLTKVNSVVFGAGTEQSAWYSYDVLDNLTGVVIGGSQSRIHDYCYDANNRLTNIKTGGCTGATVMALEYDVQGNLQQKDAQAYVFDFGNRLRSAPNEIDYLYDGYGRRVSAASGTMNPRFRSFAYSQNGQLLYEENSGSSSRTENIYLGGSLVASRSLATNIPGAQPKVSYMHTDALGTPVEATDANKAIIATQTSEYEPYGWLVNRSLTNGIGFTGHMQDASTGLTYMQQRYYDPMIGRFLSVDPVTANSSTGANFNRYWYANNNPYKFTDPDGRDPAAIAAAARSHKGESGWGNPGWQGGARLLLEFKCSAYVNQVVREAGDLPPTVIVDGNTRPATAGELADTNVKIANWPVVGDNSVQSGDIVAEAHAGRSGLADYTGHTGIIVDASVEAKTSSANSETGTVTENNWGFREGQNTTVRRYDAPPPSPSPSPPTPTINPASRPGRE